MTCSRLFAISGLLLVIGCSNDYSTLHESGSAATLGQYPVLHVGRLDLGEQRYHNRMT
jgi:uncharacterized lipoprotein YajG